MFDEKEMNVLDKDLTQLKTIKGDIQPYEKVMKFEDDIEIEISHRLFCDIEPLITDEGYLLIEGSLYKIMDIKKWSDYFEILLYKSSG